MLICFALSLDFFLSFLVLCGCAGVWVRVRVQGDVKLRPMYEGVRKALMESLAKKNAPFEAALKVNGTVFF